LPKLDPVFLRKNDIELFCLKPERIYENFASIGHVSLRHFFYWAHGKLYTRGPKS
jgi:hypothetical protein